MGKCCPDAHYPPSASLIAHPAPSRSSSHTSSASLHGRPARCSSLPHHGDDESATPVFPDVESSNSYQALELAPLPAALDEVPRGFMHEVDEEPFHGQGEEDPVGLLDLLGETRSRALYHGIVALRL
jgi:hypothetical protein